MPDLPPPPGPEPTEHRKQRLLRLALLVIVVTFAGSRAVISLGAGHLLLHLDPAEYGLLRAVAEFSDSNTRELLADPDALVRGGVVVVRCVVVVRVVVVAERAGDRAGEQGQGEQEEPVAHGGLSWLTA